MVTEKEMKNCKKEMEAVYGKMNEDELHEQLIKVVDKMSHLYKRYYENWFADDAWGMNVVNNLLHSSRVKMATIAKMLKEAKKRG